MHRASSCDGDLTEQLVWTFLSMSACSVYSFVVIAFFFLLQRRPLPEEFGRELDDIVSKMLRVDSEHRWSATEILDSPLLRRCVGEEVSQQRSVGQAVAAIRF